MKLQQVRRSETVTCCVFLKGPMQFEANGISYFLNFNPSEGRWQLLYAMPKGIGRLAIVDDGGPLLVPQTEVTTPATQHAK